MPSFNRRNFQNRLSRSIRALRRLRYGLQHTQIANFPDSHLQLTGGFVHRNNFWRSYSSRIDTCISILNNIRLSLINNRLQFRADVLEDRRRSLQGERNYIRGRRSRPSTSFRHTDVQRLWNNMSVFRWLFRNYGFSIRERVRDDMMESFRFIDHEIMDLVRIMRSVSPFQLDSSHVEDHIEDLIGSQNDRFNMWDVDFEHMEDFPEEFF